MPEDYQQYDTHQKRKFWKNHVEQWQQSGLSQRAYCRTHDPQDVQQLISMVAALRSGR